jgi:hypothetical protein
MKYKARKTSSAPGSYCGMTGITLIQLMMLLLALGIIGFFIVDLIIDKRCEEQPQRPVCTDRRAAG